jgi:UDP-2,3-diacylglucosamine pyrophosphatase LpxH
MKIESCYFTPGFIHFFLKKNSFENFEIKVEKSSISFQNDGFHNLIVQKNLLRNEKNCY